MTPQVFRLLGGVLVSIGVVSASAAEASGRLADFHVAVDGSDTHAGSAAAPFATLARAQVAVRRAIRAGLTRDVVVEVHGGIYRITEPLERFNRTCVAGFGGGKSLVARARIRPRLLERSPTPSPRLSSLPTRRQTYLGCALAFGRDDSGTSDFAVVYMATPGDTVVLDGGRRIDGWTRRPDGVCTASVPEARNEGWYPRQLFVGGRRAIRARAPNEGWCEGKPLRPIEHDATDQPLSIRINTAGGKGIFGWAREFEYDQATIPGGLPACGSPGDVELVSLRRRPTPSRRTSAPWCQARRILRWRTSRRGRRFRWCTRSGPPPCRASRSGGVSMHRLGSRTVDSLAYAPDVQRPP